MAAIQESRRITRFLLAGICSGATVSFHMASRDPRIVGTVLVNMRELHLDDEDEVSAYPIIANREYYKQAVLRLSSWCKLLTGRVEWQAVVAAALSLAKAMAAKLTQLPLTMLGRIHPTSVGADFGRLADRGVDTLLLCSKGGPEFTYLTERCGKEIQDMLSKKRLRVTFVEGGDHTFTQAEAQRLLLDILHNDLVRRLRGFGAEDNCCDSALYTTPRATSSPQSSTR